MGFAQWSDHLPIFYFLQSTLESEIQTQDQEITQQKSKIDQKANTVIEQKQKVTMLEQDIVSLQFYELMSMV